MLSMGAFCVEAGVSPRDGSGYKKGGTDLSQVRSAEVKCYKSGYKKPSVKKRAQGIWARSRCAAM